MLRVIAAKEGNPCKSNLSNSNLQEIYKSPKHFTKTAIFEYFIFNSFKEQELVGIRTSNHMKVKELMINSKVGIQTESDTMRGRKAMHLDKAQNQAYQDNKKLEDSNHCSN